MNVCAITEKLADQHTSRLIPFCNHTEVYTARIYLYHERDHALGLRGSELISVWIWTEHYFWTCNFRTDCGLSSQATSDLWHWSLEQRRIRTKKQYVTHEAALGRRNGAARRIVGVGFTCVFFIFVFSFVWAFLSWMWLRLNLALGSCWIRQRVLISFFFGDPCHSWAYRGREDACRVYSHFCMSHAVGGTIRIRFFFPTGLADCSVQQSILLTCSRQT